MFKEVNKESPELQNQKWPPVNDFEKFSAEFERFLNNENQQKIFLSSLSEEQYPEFINNSLSIIYSYLYGYSDSPCFLKKNSLIEAKLLQCKILFEDLLLDWIEKTVTEIKISRSGDVIEDLGNLVNNNISINHELFNYIANEADFDTMCEFLLNECIRNEVVDDEVALLVVGHQGVMKNVLASNLHDELGHNKLYGFHTYWLRRMLRGLNYHKHTIYSYRNTRAWFNKISSNVFNLLLFRSPFRFRSYGHFTITEGFAAPHFELIINGLKRLNLDNPDISIYFTAHLRLDPYHSNELIEGLKKQIPKLSFDELNEVMCGAVLAVKASFLQYTYMFRHFKKENK